MDSSRGNEESGNKRTFFSIKKWNPEDRPREKLFLKGKAALSNAELLAILINQGNKEETAVGLAKRILNSVDNNLNELGKQSLRQLMSFKGIGQAKAISIVAAMELGRRRQIAFAIKREKIGSSADAFELMQPVIGDLQHEEFWIIYLNNSNKILQKTQMSKGGITGTWVDIRLVLKTALEVGATNLILAHNHPSGTLVPSDSDKQLTNRIITAAKSLDITILDHLIVADNSYFSFADEEIM